MTVFFAARIKKLRRMKDGDTFVLIYLKMQLLSLQADGVLFYEGVEPSFSEELALVLDESEEKVSEVIRFLESQDMLIRMED